MKILPFLLSTLCLLGMTGTQTVVRAQPPQSQSPLSSLKKRLAERNTARVDPASTRFQPVGKRTSLDTWLKNAAQSDEDRKALKEAIDTVFDAYEQEARRLNFENDVAGALTFIISVAYQVYNGQEKIEDATTLATYRQLQSALAIDMAKLSSAEKQQVYETLIIAAGMTLVPLRIAEVGKDESATRKAREAAGGVLRELLKVEPDTVKLTGKGLEIPGVTVQASSGGTRISRLAGVPQLSWKTEGWEVRKDERGESITLTRKTIKGMLVVVLALNPEAMTGTREEAFWGLWKAGVESNFQVGDSSGDRVEMMCRRTIGNANALYYHAKVKNEVGHAVYPTSLYLIEAGTGFYYLLVRFQPEETSALSGVGESFTNARQDDAYQAVEELLAGIRLTGDYTRKPLYTVADVKGQWTRSVVASSADYVSRTTGAYLGNASSGFSEDLKLNADGTFKKETVTVVSGKPGITNTTEGKYRIEGDRLILTYLKTTGRKDIKGETRRIVGAGLNREGKKRLLLAEMDEALSFRGVQEARVLKPATEK